MTTALVVGLCVLATTGCRRRRSRTTINQGSSIFTTDDFPGTSVQDGNVSDDQRAFSPPGAEVSDVRAYFNGDRDIAMVVYEFGTSSDPFFGGEGLNLYVHYYQEGQFQPPVHLTKAVDLIGGVSSSGFTGELMYDLNDVSVAWVNTEDHGNEFAEDRDGDALLFFRGRDYDSGGGDQMNLALYYKYFDVTHSESSGFNYGFTDFAFRIDAQDDSGEDVWTHGLISDGLCGEARWFSNGFFMDIIGGGSQEDYNDRSYQWGDPTTEIILFWNQYTDDGAGPFDLPTYWVRFPLDQSGPSEDALVPTPIDTIDILAFGASNGGTDADETLVDFNYISYNLTLWHREAANAGGTPSFVTFGTVGAGTDITIQESTWNSGGTDFFATQLMHTSTPDATDADENGADFIQPFGFLDSRCVFGPDEDILEILFFHTQLEEEPTGSYGGDLTNSGDLVINQINPADGSRVFLYVDAEDVDIVDSVSPFEFDVYMSRNGDYLFWAWMELVDIGTFDDVGLWTGHVRTSRDPDVGFIPLAIATAQPSTDVDGISVNEFEFQIQLGYVCGQQSDAEVMNVFYEQSDGSYDEVSVVRLTADLVAASAAFFFTDTLVVGDDDPELFDGSTGVGMDLFEATDSGEGGNYFCVFIRDIDSAIENDDQLFGLRTGLVSGFGEIDSNQLFRLPGSVFFLAGTPFSDNIAEFDVDGDNDDERESPNEQIHVIFSEHETTEYSVGTAMALRTRRVDTDPDAGLVFGDMFEPDLVDPPFQLSRVQADVNLSPFVIDLLIGDGGVSLFFHQEDHTYYQAHDDSANEDEVGWLLVDDDDDAPPTTDPILVDDDDQETALSEFVFTRVCSCEEAHGAMIFWLKALDGGPIRAQVRVLDQGD
jgi:hypothetical protein